MDFLSAKPEEKREENEEEVIDANDGNTLAIPPMSDDGKTDKETTVNSEDPGSVPTDENCVVLNTLKGPLSNDVKLLNDNQFNQLISTCMGSANIRNESYGWANFGDFKDEDTFKDTLTVASAYPLKKTAYETCTENRQTKPQKFIDGDGEKIKDPGLIKYDMKLIETQETKELPNVLNLLFSNMKNSLSDTDKEYNLLTSFGEYLSEEIEIINNPTKLDEKYKKIMTLQDNGVNVFDVSKLKNEDDEASKVHKMLFCFAWKHSGAEDEVKGGMMSSNDAVVEGNSSPPRGRYKKYIMYTICIIAYIYFAFVLFESYRLLIGSVNRILDARAVYLEMNPGLNELGEEDGQGGANHNYLNYFYSFFTILYQSGAGTLIDVLSTYQSTAILKAKEIMNTVAHEAGRTSFDRCQQGWFSCINGYLTGSSQSEAITAANIVADAKFSTEYINVIKEIKLNFTKIISDADFATKGFITGINGMVTATIIMGNMYNPSLYRIEHVTASIASLQSSYLTSPIYGVFAIGTNISILFAPNALKDVPSESTRFAEENVQSTSSSFEETVPEPPVTEPPLPIDSVTAREREVANTLANMGKGGGKRKTGKRKLKRKTIKKRKKGRKTKRRKTIKKKRRKTKRKN